MQADSHRSKSLNDKKEPSIEVEAVEGINIDDITEGESSKKGNQNFLSAKDNEEEENISLSVDKQNTGFWNALKVNLAVNSLKFQI